MGKISQFIGYMKRVAGEPVGELSRWQRYVRFSVDLGLHSLRTLRRVNVGQMSASLTYRTIFSLVPILVLGLIVYSSFVETDEARGMFKDQIYGFLNLDVIVGKDVEEGASQINSGIGFWSAEELGFDVVTEKIDGGEAVLVDEVEAKEAGAEASRAEMRETINGKIDELMDNAANVSLKSIGVVGFVLLIWSAVALIVGLEKCFNAVYQVSKGRTLVSRFVMYWFVLTLGPCLLAVSFGSVDLVISKMSGVAVIGGFVLFLSQFASLISSWVLLFVLFLFLPNAKVKFRAALMGSFVSAVMWEMGQFLFEIYVKNAVTNNVLYGSLGLIPLFLLGVYMTWWVVLFGLQMTYTMQTIRGFQLQRDEGKGGEGGYAGDPMRLINLMMHIGRGFVVGKAVSREALSTEMGCSVAVVDELIDLLLGCGLIHEIKEGGFAVSEPLEKIELSKLVGIGVEASVWRGMVDDEAERGIYAVVNDARSDALGGKTVRDLVGG